jgi:hypothetical protein
VDVVQRFDHLPASIVNKSEQKWTKVRSR